uniref:hypothetical protein n=1 Tax=Micromonospora sp. NBC_00855 TaxID=2975978 RepID=UPI00224D1AB7|nr:hypothetical protein OHB51_35325 [Micromonospora sp. NBC_00855]
MSDKYKAFRASTLLNLVTLAKVLGMLPIPIEIKVGALEDGTIEDLHRARVLLPEIPMSEVLHAAVNTAILDWFAGLTLGSVADENEDDAPWLYTAAQLSQTRCRDAIEVAYGILTGEIVIED